MAESTVKTEADALRDILEWSGDRPVWQRDALRRLVQQGELGEDDVDSLTALCKDGALENEALAEGHISAQHAGAPTVALKNIRNVQNVNALAQHQSLNFIPTGVTIIYGDNGAGKSGYVRILKRACRARTTRGREEPILPNIYEDAVGPQRAELEYHVGAQTQKSEWKIDEPSDGLLSEISVFDSRTANVHVEETNDLAYTPYPMKLLERLVNACKAVKDKLDAEIAAIKAQTPKSISEPTCSLTTKTGLLIAILSKDTKPEEVEELATLSDEELARLAELASDFAQDPAATARRLRAQKTRLQNLRNQLEALTQAAAPENGAKLAALAADLSTKHEAAKLAAQDLSQAEPLDGVGSATWQKLWEAARAYSTTEAYPELAFPKTDADAVCVLCQQELGQDAADRLRRFEAFVQDRTQQEEAEARRVLASFRSDLAEAAIARRDLLNAVQFIRDELGNEALAKLVRDFIVQTQWRLRAILNANADVDHFRPALAGGGLDTHIDALEVRAAALLADDESEERKKLRAELAELQDRQWLAGIKNDVLAEITRLQSIFDLDAAVKDTRANAITAKNTALSEALITDRLRARFAQEIDHLNLAGLAIELTQARSQAGISRFKIGLIESASSNAGDVLSEGEYRCVALAGFMAELATNNSGSGIIFDDPVSSLDHLHREAIAKRLAAEGRNRQVIVFTHDLPFLFLLRNACIQGEDADQPTEIALRHIQKRQKTPGHCRNEAPEKAQDAASRLKTMRTHLGNTRIQHEQDPDGTAWLMTARGIIDSLRQTWEAAVEDSISPVLRTFASKVNTKGFAKLSAITIEDAETMRKHYGQCSVLLHKTSDAMNPAAPKPEDIEAELDALDTWLQAVTERQKQVSTA